MRIAFFADNFLPQVNGAVTATLSLIKGLADKGHKVYVFAPKYSHNEEFCYKNVTIKRIPSIPAFIYPDLRATSFFSLETLIALKKEKIEVIHLNAPLTLGMSALVCSKILRIPLVGTFHTFFGDPQYLKHIGLNFKAFEKFSWFYSKIIYGSCDLLTSPSETTKRELIDNKIKKKVLVISNGIDGNVFDNSNYLKIKKKYNSRGPLLLFLGRISHEKNIFYLLDCFKLAIKKIPNAKLLMIGDGPQMKIVKNKIKEENLQENIILTGKIDHSKLIKSSIFGACDLFVTASITENQPMTVLEAQANGLVCIGIDKKGMRDLIKNNYNGALLKYGDKEAFANAIVRILSNKSIYHKMKINTLKEIKKHQLTNVINTWEKELKRLVSSYKGGE